jgi:hypothetical protein
VCFGGHAGPVSTSVVCSGVEAFSMAKKPGQRTKSWRDLARSHMLQLGEFLQNSCGAMTAGFGAKQSIDDSRLLPDRTRQTSKRLPK